MKLHVEAVAESLLKVLRKLMSIKELEPFRLVGGTALALLYGHRSSVDIDLFAGGRIDITSLVKVMRNHFGDNFSLDVTMQNGISGQVDGVKVDLFDWKVPFIHDPLVIDEIRFASPKDIYAYKCEAIIDRKAEKDFCDIGEIIKHNSLEELIDTFKKRYPFISTGAVFPVLLKSSVIVRDNSIKYFNENTFDQYLLGVRHALERYEKEILNKKIKSEEERINKIKELIEKKRASKNE
jgi:hypothetical protein